MTPEGKVKEKIKKWLGTLGAWTFMPVSNGMGQHGIPDHVACIPVTITPSMVGMTIGMFAGIEAKAPDKRNTVSGHQYVQIHRIRRANGLGIVVAGPEDLSLADSYLERIKLGADRTLIPFPELKIIGKKSHMKL